MLDHDTVIYTDHDHAGLKSLLNTRNLSGKLARRGMAIQEFSPEFRYRPGKKNGSADALSRVPLGRRDSDSEPDRSSGADSVQGVTIPVATITTM